MSRPFDREIFDADVFDVDVDMLARRRRVLSKDYLGGRTQGTAI